MSELNVIVTLFLQNDPSFFQALESIDASRAGRIEIRLDSYYPGHSLLQTNALIKQIAQKAKLPVLYTLRTEGEKKDNPCSLQEYGWLINILAKDGYDFDLEYRKYRQLKEGGLLPDMDYAHVFLSAHEFEAYHPEQLETILLEMKQVPAFCLKMAQYCQTIEQVFSFIKQVQKAWDKRESAVIAMGEAGLITRLAPWLFGFDYTYCGYEGAVAPGQLSLEQMEQYQSLLRK